MSALMLRFARLEFRHGLRWTAWADVYRRLSRGRRVSGCWIVGVMFAVLLWAMVSFGIPRTDLVEWADPPLTITSALAWLLWSLGGIYVAAAALTTGWAGWDTPYLMKGGTGRPSATWGLPISWRDVAVAKALGRTAAFVVHLLIGVAILALARFLMIAGDLVTVPPTLADPWFYDAFIAHVGLVIIAVRVISAGRKHYHGAASLRFFAFIAAAASGFVAALRLFPTDQFLNWWSITGFTCALAAVIIVALLQMLPPVRRLERMIMGRSASQGAARSRADLGAWRHIGFLAEYMSMATRGLGGMRGKAGVFLTGMLHHTGLMALLLALASALLQAGALAYYAIAGMTTSGQPALPDPFLMDFFVGVPALGVFGMAVALAGLALWPEVTPGRLARMMNQQPDEESVRHSGDLLPAQPRRVWLQRLATLPLVWVMLAAGGLVSLLLSMGARIVLDPRVTLSGTRFVSPRLMLAIGAMAGAISLGLFLAAPILHRAHRLIPMTVQSLGCLGFVALFGGMMAPIVIMILIGWERDLYVSALIADGFVVALVVWLALSVAVSRSLWQPGAWRHEDDGRPSTMAVAQAVLVYGWAMLGAFLTGSIFQAVMRLITPD